MIDAMQILKEDLHFIFLLSFSSHAIRFGQYSEVMFFFLKCDIYTDANQAN